MSYDLWLHHTYNYTEYIISGKANKVNSFYINPCYYLPQITIFYKKAVKKVTVTPLPACKRI